LVLFFKKELLPSPVTASPLTRAAALTQAGKPAEAIVALREAIALDPSLLVAHVQIARLLAETGQGEAALAHCRTALALDGGAASALAMHAFVLRRLNRLIAAEAAYQDALALHPRDVALLRGLAGMLFEAEAFEESAALYRQAAAIEPGNADVRVALASTLAALGDLAGARAAHDQAIAVAPGSLTAWRTRGFFLGSIGQFDAAAADYAQCLRIDPNYAPALLHLVRIHRAGGDEAVRRDLARILATPAIDARLRAQAGFALGDLLDRDERIEDAFAHYTAANIMHRRYREVIGERFDPAAMTRAVCDIEQGRGAAQIHETEGWGNPTSQPVFIVGFTRSGTTLVEQICGGHSQVVAGGELRALQRIAGLLGQHNAGTAPIRDWDKGFARGLADTHAQRLSRLGGGARYVTDKLPFNVLRLGWANALFPQARVIWCRRDKRDLVASNHFQYFSSGNLFTTDIAHCALATVLAERAGLFWQRHLRLPLLEVQYETLVTEPEAQARRIIAFLGLGWEAACLDVAVPRRPVITLSQFQVRQSVSARSVGRWRRYAKQLKQMFEIQGIEEEVLF
jgi:tetratricopeptide (TPR) repeat protein